MNILVKLWCCEVYETRSVEYLLVLERLLVAFENNISEGNKAVDGYNVDMTSE